MSDVLVLGLGNLLLRDEGLGVRAVERLQKAYRFPPQVRLLDGGTLGLELLPYLEEAERVLVLDAVAAEGPPGTLVRLDGGDLPGFLARKVSPHQVGLSDLLAVARLRGTLPEEVVLLGMVPARLDAGLELSPPVEAALPQLVEAALAELRRWGVEAQPLPAG